MYKVIKHFFDLQDCTKTKENAIYHEYNVGDEYPRKGLEVSAERIAELSGSDNKQGEPLIAEQEEPLIAEQKETKKAAARKTTAKKTEK